jgi:hypothetical protein
MSPLDLIHRFLVYHPDARMRAHAALTHRWFKAEPLVLLPKDYPAQIALPRDTTSSTRISWEGKTLDKWLRFVVPDVYSSPAQYDDCW